MHGHRPSCRDLRKRLGSTLSRRNNPCHICCCHVLGRMAYRQLPIKLIQSVLQTIRFGLQSSNHARQILLLLHCKSLVAGLPEPAGMIVITMPLATPTKCALSNAPELAPLQIPVPAMVNDIRARMSVENRLASACDVRATQSKSSPGGPVIVHTVGNTERVTTAGSNVLSPTKSFGDLGLNFFLEARLSLHLQP